MLKSRLICHLTKLSAIYAHIDRQIKNQINYDYKPMTNVSIKDQKIKALNLRKISEYLKLLYIG